MELKTDPTKILMSDALRGQLPELESDEIDQLSSQYVHVVVDRWVGQQQIPLIGLLKSVLFDLEPELEIKVELKEALSVVKARDLRVEGFELQHGEDETVTVPGPFNIKAARIEDINAQMQTCVLSLQLLRAKKS